MSDILVLKSPYCLKRDKANELYESFVKQKESGVVIIPGGWTAELVPDDIEIVMQIPSKVEDCAHCGTKMEVKENG